MDTDDSEEEEATALDLRASSRSAAARQAKAVSKPAPAPLARPSPRRPLADSDEDEEATEFLQARPSTAKSSAPSPPSSSSAPVSVVSETGLRARGRAVPLADADVRPPSSPPTPSPAVGTALPSGNLPDPITHRPLPSGRHHAPIDSDRTGSLPNRTSTASVPRITRIHVVNKGMSTTNEVEPIRIGDDDDENEATVPPGAAEAQVHRPSARAKPKKPSTMVDAVDDATVAPSDPDATHAPHGPEATYGDDADDAVEDIEDIRNLDASPQVTGTVAAPDLGSSSTGDDDIPSEPAIDAVDVPHRRVPLTAEGEPMPTRPRDPRARRDGDQAAGQGRAPQAAFEERAIQDGVLVIDAPAEASITVNGVERGRGQVRVTDLDRNAKHAVRIHCPGFTPWSGSVSLRGKAAAKIRPSLKPRQR